MWHSVTAYFVMLASCPMALHGESPLSWNRYHNFISVVSSCCLLTWQAFEPLCSNGSRVRHSSIFISTSFHHLSCYGICFFPPQWNQLLVSVCIELKKNTTQPIILEYFNRKKIVSLIPDEARGSCRCKLASPPQNKLSISLYPPLTVVKLSSQTPEAIFNSFGRRMCWWWERKTPS